MSTGISMVDGFGLTMTSSSNPKRSGNWSLSGSGSVGDRGTGLPSMHDKDMERFRLRLTDDMIKLEHGDVAVVVMVLVVYATE